MQVEPVKVEFIMETNVKSFNDGVNYARDTGKKIDQELRRKLELDIAQAQLKLQEIRADLRKTKDSDARISLQVEANAAQRSLTEFKRQLNNLSNTWDASLSRLQMKFNGLWDSIKWALGSIWGALWFASVWVVVWSVLNSVKNLGANLQQVTIAFETMLGSAEKAKVFLQDLSDFAAITPFNIGDVRDNAKQLLAMWVAADNVIPTMKALWDVAAWLWVPMDRLALAYWQVITKGRLQWGELKQFVEAGVPLIETLAKSMGVAQSEIAGLVEDGQISAVEVTKAFQMMSGEGGRFANLMEKQSKSFNWLVSNIQDSVTRIGEYIGMKLIPTLTSIAEWLAQTTADYWYAFGELFAWFVTTITDTLMRGAQGITEFYNVIMWNTEAVGEQQVTFTELVYKAFKVLLIGLQATIKGIQAIGWIVGTVLWVRFNHVQSYVTNTVNTALSAINFVSKAINAVTGASIKPIELFRALPQLSYFTELKAVSGEIAQDFLSIDTDLTLRKSLQTAKKLKEIDLSKIGSTQKTKDWSGGAASKEEKAMKDRHDAEIKAIDLQAQREVDAIKKSVDDEQTKADKIVKILEEADKKKKKMNDEYNKTAENYNKQQLDDAKELLKQEEELKKKKEQYVEKEKKLLSDLADANKKNSQAIYDDVKKKLEETGEEIKKITDKITDLKKELADLGSEKNSSIAQRVVEINKELQKSDLTVAERVKLMDELSLATANTTQEEINRQDAISKENKTQTIIREFNEKKAELEAKLKLEEDNLKAQLKIETDYKDQKLKLETDYTTAYKEEINKRETAEMESIARIKNALMDLRSQAVQDSVITPKKAETLNEYMNTSASINQKSTATRRLSVPWSTSSNNQTTNNNNITQNNNINSQVDLDSVNRDLANKIIV